VGSPLHLSDLYSSWFSVLATFIFPRLKNLTLYSCVPCLTSKKSQEPLPRNEYVRRWLAIAPLAHNKCQAKGIRELAGNPCSWAQAFSPGMHTASLPALETPDHCCHCPFSAVTNNTRDWVIYEE
jgi:hypothetical protein